MASLVLSFAGAAIGGTFGAVGAVAGRIVGAVAGAMVDRALFGPRAPDGPRLADLNVLASTEGAPIPRLYGRMRVGGQVIWATRLEESVEGGGKGGSPKGTTYSYAANIAVGLCEGPIAGIGRIWADGKELDQQGLTIRVHRGTEDQEPDPLIVAKEGAVGTPAYRGLAYVVFERLVLDDFGSRVPQLAFEVLKPVGALEEMVRSAVVIPGATEFGYEPGVYTREFGFGRSAPETRHTSRPGSDFTESLDELQALCPNLEAVSLVVAWFGTDLRAGLCEIRPSVERRDKAVSGLDWQAAGETRASARLVSAIDGRPAYGGSPSDATVIRAIRDLKARGLKVTLIPFVMMDVPPANGFTDPWTGAVDQPAFPWRGRITVTPAAGRPGSPDGSGAAAAEIAAFLGTATSAQFSAGAGGVGYAGPDEWRYRRFVLHMAHLAKAAGGVDAFAVGSEMVGLTRVRGAAGHPFVDGLVALAAEVAGVLPEATLTYAADWTEYGGQARGLDLAFPLDPLWASPHIGAVGIDWYAPLADRRDDSPGSPYDRAALAAGLASGEGFDWYYADDGARVAGARTPITDGLGKPWVHRQKDLLAWWSNPHVARVGGVETAATAWVPRSKPIWLTELGVPAVDKGANRPSVFPDPKSAENGLPPFSAGTRDDLIQRRALEAVLGALDPAFGASEAANPVSPVYGGRMVDPARTALWAWDARPWPAFPRAADIWADGGNWETGHWLNGRLGAAPVADLARAVLADYGLDALVAEGVEGVLDGMAIERPMSARDALEPVARAFGIDLKESADRLVLAMGDGGPAAALDLHDLVEEEDRPPLSLTRQQEAELPRELSLAFGDTEADFRTTAVGTRRLVGATTRVASLALAAAADPGEMAVRAEMLLHRLWAGREQAGFALPPSRLALEAGDAVTVEASGRSLRLRLTGLEGSGMRRASAETLAPPIRPRRPASARRPYALPAFAGPAAVVILDLPPLSEADPPVMQYLAAAADPWRGPYTVWRGTAEGGDEAVATLSRPSLMGETVTSLAPGPVWVWDRTTHLTVRLVTGSLAGLPEARVLAGANACAVEAAPGLWEVLQFRDAMLIADRTYVLSTLLRGQRGTEHAVSAVAAGARVVFLDGPLTPLVTGLDAVGRPQRYRIGPANRDAADPAAVERTATAGTTALLPFAPVHLKARRTAGGIRLSWIRRTRVGGDSWELNEVPLGEEAERYRLAILSPLGAEVRVVETAEPAWLYPAAAEAADFGGPVASLAFRVAQISVSAGPGRAASALAVL